MSESTEPTNDLGHSISFIFPMEMIRLIAELAPYPAIALMSRVCKSWKAIFDDNYWKRRLERLYGEDAKKAMKDYSKDHMYMLKVYSKIIIGPDGGSAGSWAPWIRRILVVGKSFSRSHFRKRIGSFNYWKRGKDFLCCH